MAWRDDPWSEVFDADYLRFYEEPLEERSDRATDLIVRLLTQSCSTRPAATAGSPIGSPPRAFAWSGSTATQPFLERARTDAAAMGVEVEYVLGDLRDLRLSRTFDAALNWFTSFAYFDEAANRRLLGAYRGLLRPGARLLLEQHHRDFLLRLLPPGGAALVHLEERGDDLMIDKISFDLAASRWRTERIMVREGRVRRVRFSPAAQTLHELISWLHEAGFAQVVAYDEAGEPLTPDSPRISWSRRPNRWTGAFPPKLRPRSAAGRLLRTYRRVFVTLGRYRWFAVFVDRVLTPTERALYRATSGRVTLAHAGDRVAVPELMLITRGHKSGLEAARATARSGAGRGAAGCARRGRTARVALLGPQEVDSVPRAPRANLPTSRAARSPLC